MQRARAGAGPEEARGNICSGTALLRRGYAAAHWRRRKRTSRNKDERKGVTSVTQEYPGPWVPQVVLRTGDPKADKLGPPPFMCRSHFRGPRKRGEPIVSKGGLFP